VFTVTTPSGATLTVAAGPTGISVTADDPSDEDIAEIAGRAAENFLSRVYSPGMGSPLAAAAVAAAAAVGGSMAATRTPPEAEPPAGTVF
jgi:hypothetical protein